MEKRYSIFIYRDKEQILMVPFILHVNGGYYPSFDVVQIKDIENEKLIGEGVLKGIEIINKSAIEPTKVTLDELKEKRVYKRYTKYKSLKKFLLNVANIIVSIRDGQYDIYTS